MAHEDSSSHEGLVARFPGRSGSSALLHGRSQVLRWWQLPPPPLPQGRSLHELQIGHHYARLNVLCRHYNLAALIACCVPKCTCF